MREKTELKDLKESPQDVSLKELLIKCRYWINVILSKWIIIVGFGIFGCVLGFYYAKSKTAMYTATTTFVLENFDKSPLSQYAGVAAMVGVDLGGGGGGIFHGENIQELYKSRVMIEKSLLSPIHQTSSELLIDRYIDFNNMLIEWEAGDQKNLLRLNFRDDPETLDEVTLRLRDSLIRDFATNINNNMLRVGLSDKKSSIIKVDVQSPDEIFSKSFNQSLVQHVNEFYRQTKTMKSANNIEILQHKTDSVRRVLNGTIYSSANLLDATPNLNPTRQARRTAPVQQAQADAEAAKAVLTQLVQNLELSKMSVLQEQPLIQVVDEPILPLPVTKTSAIKFAVIAGFMLAFIATAGIVVRHFIKTL